MRKNAIVFCSLMLAAAGPLPPVVMGLDHMPVAVANLDQAAADFAKMGFTLKPGRNHDDGIRNDLIKFANGTGIELITAANPADPLATEYADWLKQGDGPAFWSFYSPDLGAVAARLDAMKLGARNDGEIVTFAQSAMAHRFFFASRAPSPTDKPAYFVHANTATRLAAVWVAPGRLERKLLRTLVGGQPAPDPACNPFSAPAEPVLLPEGDELILVHTIGRLPETRSVIGATVMVRSLDTLRTILRKNSIPFSVEPGCPRNSLWIRPPDAHNLWLEFRQ